MHLRTVLLTAAACLMACTSSAETLTSDKYIALMRHGVRPQTSMKELEKMSPKAWAKWDTADGQLTPHGAEAAAQLARWEVSMLRSKGLVAASGCPAKGDVFGWANGPVQRTIDTGNVVLSTMFEGCGLKVGFVKAEVDPLYAASDTALGAIDPSKAKAAILEAAGGSFDAMKAKVQPLMKEMDAILGCDAPGSACSLQNREWSIEVKEAKGDKPASVSLKGPLAEAGTAAQVFLLQYANGFPADQVAFGKASTATDIIRLSELRQVKYDIGNRVPYLAKRDASNFLNQLVLALGTGPRDAAPQGGPPNAKFLLLMGSDTQQVEIAAILGLHWKIPPYLDDETPPTGALTFERLHDASGKVYVKLGFVAPSLDQIRNASAINEASPPLQAAVTVPGCEAEAVDGACPLDTFISIARSKMDMTAVAAVTYN
ncbi:histidine-type phosphatase [Rhizobium oryzicola]|uniref:Histidine-type phosphatase n=1 Tax=Rhizobium oryzicola TaxID=1232668 RepID=A0ABT8SR71_9HYPH|nr:histidine-type phosphatase [Rhizobium oryzicola]MDO1580930.1 histidine-type phosphatase [Rhizobium oryzicola]